MSEKNSVYRALARKYRPQTLDDLVGQEVLVGVLMNAFKTGRIAHAFMLTGVRGIGKTTTARLIAKALNCKEENKPSYSYICNKCDSCLSIMEDRSLDVIEMDAASKTGVDDIRELIDSVKYKPLSSKYKIFIIDEVHMLSTSAFNALLKTLEEPPEHVKFIFATTEIRKVPITVLSRCQRFDLKRLDRADMLGHLKKICESEQVKCDDDTLGLIVRASEGSVRDALSILDQAIVLCGDTLDSKKISTMLNRGSLSDTYGLISAFLSSNAKEAMRISNNLYASGAQPSFIVESLLEVCSNLMVLRAVKSLENEGIFSKTELDLMEPLLKDYDLISLNRLWQILLQGLDEIKNSFSPKMHLDALIIKVIWASSMPNISDIVENLENKSAEGLSPKKSNNAVPSKMASDVIDDVYSGYGTQFTTSKPSTGVNQDEKEKSGEDKLQQIFSDAKKI